MLKLKNTNWFVILIIIGSFLAPTMLTTSVWAAPTCNDGQAIPDDVIRNSKERDFCSTHEGYGVKIDCNSTSPDKNNCGIVAYLVRIINVLSGLVGIVVVLMIAYGGIKYTMSRDNAQETAAAKERIRNAVVALVFYLFIFGFLQWLVPGGIF